MISLDNLCFQVCVYSSCFPHLWQYLASWVRTCPHCGQILVMGLPNGAPVGGLSLTMRYRIKPSMLVKRTIIAHRMPFSLLDSASW